MSFKQDYNELLLKILRGLVKDAIHFEEIVSGSAADLDHIVVKVGELQLGMAMGWIFNVQIQVHER